MTTDVNAIQAFVSSALLGILVDLFRLIGMVGLMLYLDWEFTLIALITAPLLVVYTSRLMSAVKQATREVRKKPSKLVSIEQEAATSMMAIQAFGREDFEESRFQQQNVELTAAATKARRRVRLGRLCTPLETQAGAQWYRKPQDP